jgi:hypothetical protein
MEQRPRQQRQLDHHQQIVNDPNFDRKFDQITAGARPYIRDHLLTRITRANCMVIIDYILALQTEVSPSDSYRIDTIFKLKQLAEFHNPKPFKDMTRQDIIDYLDRLRKPESVDPMHKWIGTYEHSRIIITCLQTHTNIAISSPTASSSNDETYLLQFYLRLTQNDSSSS